MVSSTLTRFSTSLLYYGLTLNTGGFGLNLYLTQFIFGVVEIPAILSCLFLIQHFGRKITQAGFLFFGGVACLMVLAIPKGTLKTFAMFFFLKKCVTKVEFVKCVSDMYFVFHRSSSGGHNHCLTGEIFFHCLFQHTIRLYCRVIPNHFKVMLLFMLLLMIIT